MEIHFNDITKPRYSEQILPVPWPFVISKFHCSNTCRSGDGVDCLCSVSGCVGQILGSRSRLEHDGEGGGRGEGGSELPNSAKRDVGS